MKLKLIIFLFYVLKEHVAVSSDLVYIGMILDSSTHQPVVSAHIVNLNSNRATISDTSGMFKIHLNFNDSLLIQSLEYQKYILKLEKSYMDTNLIYLTKERYPIKEVTVGILGNYNQFKEMVLSYNPDDHKYKIPGMKEPVYRPIPILEDEEYWKNYKVAIFNPISYLYYNYNKRMKSVYKYHDLKKQENEQNRADDKYNKDFVSEITGLTDEEEIMKFMLFCDFSHEMIMNTNQYQLGQLIVEKYSEYSKNLHNK